MIKLDSHFLLLFIGVLVFFSCEGDDAVNPFDPGAGDYDPPETTIITGPNNSLQTSNSVTYTFEGNELVSEFSYRLDIGAIEGTWSDWISQTQVTFSNLDEGIHTFNVKGRYTENDEDQTPATASFEIDAVRGQSIVFYPRAPEVALNSVFSVAVVAEEVEGVSGIEIELEFDDSFLSPYGTIAQGTVLADEIVIEEITDNTIKITIGITSGPDGQNLSGTETLFTLEFEAKKAGSTDITFESVYYRDQNNNEIDINETIDCTLLVE